MPSRNLNAVNILIIIYYKDFSLLNDHYAEKKYSKEDVEKYLLLTDPTFYKFYYNKGEGHQYNIKCVNTTSKPSVSAPIMPAKGQDKVIKQKNKSDVYKKAKKMRDAGAFFTATCILPVGIPLLIKGQKEMQKYQ